MVYLDRQRRVKRIRRFIFVVCPIMLLVFMILSVGLIIRIAVLEREVDKGQKELDYYLELQSEWEYSRLQAEEQILSDSQEGTAEQAAQGSQKEPGSQGDSEASGEGQPSGRKEAKPLSSEEVRDLTLGNEELYDGYRKVYLTFDDGPSVNTSAILDILDRYGVKATFFVIMREGASYEKLYRRIVDEGHTLGMHSTSHRYSEVYAGEEAFIEDTKALRDFLYMVTGTESNFYRFPGGSSNRVSTVPMETYCKLLHENGIEYYDWNVSARDAVNPIPDADTVYWNVRSGLSDHDEAIILFHDMASKGSTVQALPRIIEYIQSLDNTVILPITDTTEPIQHLITE